MAAAHRGLCCMDREFDTNGTAWSVKLFQRCNTYFCLMSRILYIWNPKKSLLMFRTWIQIEWIMTLQRKCQRSAFVLYLLEHKGALPIQHRLLVCFPLMYASVSRILWRVNRFDNVFRKYRSFRSNTIAALFYIQVLEFFLFFWIVTIQIIDIRATFITIIKLAFARKYSGHTYHSAA